MEKAIIYVDSDLVALRNMEQLLTTHLYNQYVIETASRSDEALKVVRRLLDMNVRVALILTPYEVQDMNGLELIKRIHLMSPKTKALLFCEDLSLNSLEELGANHVFRFIRKDYPQEALLQMMDEALKADTQDYEMELLYEKLKQSESEKNLILGSIAEGMIFIDHNYDILWMNENAQLEFQSGNTGTKCFQLLYGINRPCLDCEVFKILSGAKLHTAEKKFSHDIYRLIKYYPVQDQEGNNLGVLMSFMDVTTRKRMEAMNEVLLEVAKQVNSCDSTISLYQKVYDLLAMEFDVKYMCVAGKDFDNIYIEYIDGKDKLISCKKLKIKEHEHVIELMSKLTKQSKTKDKNKHIVNYLDDDIEIAFSIHDRIIIFIFDRLVLGEEVLLKFLKSLCDQVQTGLEKIDNIKKITYQANHDSLTGLYNREYFIKTVNGKIFAQRETDRLTKMYALLVLDLNYFKEVNDTYGHIHGDEVLFNVAQRLLKSIRHCDIVARIGGDEFAMLIEHTSKSEVIRVVTRIQESIGRPVRSGKAVVQIGSSVGIVYDISKYVHSELAIKDADIAMYEAKRFKEGFGTYRFFEKDIQEKVQQQSTMEAYLKEATVCKEFSLRYQPIVSLQNFQVMGFEALVRWETKEGVLFSPNEFIPLAEDNGLIEKIGNFVIDEVEESIRYLCSDNCFVSLNFSAKQLISSQQLERIENLTLNNPRIQVEVTERALSQNYKKVFNSVKKLQEMGVKIHLDDFGTGFFALSYLNTLHIDDLKIDNSFVRQLPYDGDSVKIVRTIVAVAKNLGLTVTAEGIESYEQLYFLKELGCDFAQGYFIALPLTLPEAIQFMKNNPLGKIKDRYNQL